MITRSKRKYDKPELKTSQVGKKQKSSNEHVDSKIEEKLEKPKRQTIKSLNSKIEHANNFLAKLSQKIKDRDQEINELKQTISANRQSNDETNKRAKPVSEVERVLLSAEVNESRTHTSVPVLKLHDFPLIDEEMEEQSSEGDDESTLPIVENTEPAVSFDRQAHRHEKSTRSRSRSRSKDGRKGRKKWSRSRSRSRNRDGMQQRQSLQDYKNNPDIQGLVKKMVAEQVQQEMAKRQKLDNTSGMMKVSGEKITPKFLSNSDTSIYTPAVPTMFNCDQPRLSGSPQNMTNGQNISRSLQIMMNDAHVRRYSTPNKYNPESINETLTKLRIVSGQASTSRNETTEQREQLNNAKTAAENAIIEAERHKARVQQPNRGRFLDDNNSLPIKFNNPLEAKHDTEVLRQMRYLDQDDDEFFHTTCHIDEVTREKIEKGGYLELDKLLQKKVFQGPKEESRMQLVNRDGVSYFVPSIDKDTKIDSIKKWEQAFRVYTTIYCKANPTRAGEILQYTDIIHRAAAIFNWDNVAKYDYVFRQLMATNPHRSWAKVYTQMWNLTLMNQ